MPLLPLRRWNSPHGWFFVAIPEADALPVTHPWGRTPVTATVDGHTWATSTWRHRTEGAVLMVPAAARVGRVAGDQVEVTIAPRGELEAPAPRRRR